MAKNEKAKIEETMETVETVEAKELDTVEETQEEKKPSLGSKVFGGLKKHGKKIAVGIAAVGVVAVSYALGNKSGRSSVDSDDYDCDYNSNSSDIIDCETYSVSDEE